MLNYETILSSYDDKLTLMQWLKKVEDALKNASAVAFNVTKTGDATLTFSLDFEDGSKIESGPIVLQQGESVESAAITNGHLYLTLTNGDVLDAGSLFNGTIPQIDVTTLNVSGSVSTPALTTTGNEISAQKPVVEVMTGYSFTNVTTDINWSPVYIGACKNGNKLTLVLFGSYTKLPGDSAAPYLGYITVPQSVADKIYPFTIGAVSTYVDLKTISFFYGQTDKVDIPYRMTKNVGGRELKYWLSDTSSLTAGNTYFFRIETTFLLSDNLAA